MLANGKYYYRLKVIDHDLRFFYSTVKSILFSDVTEFSIYPNPAMDEINLLSSANAFSYAICTVEGKILESGDVSTNNKRIQLKNIPKGVYYIKMNTEEETKTIKFLKQ